MKPLPDHLHSTHVRNDTPAREQCMILDKDIAVPNIKHNARSDMFIVYNTNQNRLRYLIKLA